MSELEYITPKIAQTLKKNNIVTVSDLLFSFPNKYDDYTIVNYDNAEPEVTLTIGGVVQNKAGRGKHTTRHIELLEINGGFIIDTPGFGSLDFSGMDVASLSHSFLEFFEASKNCKYNMCLHLNEPNCKVKEEVENGTILKSRYENYLLFIDEIKGQRVVYRKNDGKKEIKK